MATVAELQAELNRTKAELTAVKSKLLGLQNAFDALLDNFLRFKSLFGPNAKPKKAVKRVV